jgi:hypothetical protein
VREQYRFHALIKAPLSGGDQLDQLGEKLRDMPDVQVTIDPYFML